jgi:hypothetical protein
LSICNSRQQAVFRDIEKQRLSGTRTARCIQDYRQPELFSAMNYKRTLPPPPLPQPLGELRGEGEGGREGDIGFIKPNKLFSGHCFTFETIGKQDFWCIS